VDPKAVTWIGVTVGDWPSKKPGEVGQMVKASLTICGIDAILFSTEQLRTMCSVFKLTGYRSKPKEDLLQSIGVGKVHQSLYHATNPSSGNGKSDGKAPAKTRNCMFQLINILFSSEVSPKFEQLGARKDKSVLDSGLAGNDEYFWQEIAKKYQEKNDDYNLLAYDNAFFDGVDPSVKLEHNWSKLKEIFKNLTKSYGEVFGNHKKSGNHDDFINFCGARSEMYYLHLWLEEKPQL
jgi:hypothetical protein